MKRMLPPETNLVARERVNLANRKIHLECQAENLLPGGVPDELKAGVARLPGLQNKLGVRGRTLDQTDPLDSPLAGWDVAITPVIGGNAGTTHVSKNERTIEFVPQAHSYRQSLVIRVLEDRLKIGNRRRKAQRFGAERLVPADGRAAQCQRSSLTLNFRRLWTLLCGLTCQSRRDGLDPVKSTLREYGSGNRSQRDGNEKKSLGCLPGLDRASLRQRVRYAGTQR